MRDIRLKEAYACIDASVKGNYMGAYFLIVSGDNNQRVEGAMYSNE